MLKVNSTELQNNFGRYLMLAQDQDILITRNGQEVAKLSAANSFKKKTDSGNCAEEALSSGYGLRKATYEGFLELTKDTDERYEYIDGDIFLLSSPKSDHQLALGEIYGTFFNFFRGKTCIPMVAPYDITIKRSEDNINVVQPDVMVICDLDEQLGDDGYYKGVPTLVVEILSDNTLRNDLIKKLDLYMAGGVAEYWIADPKNKTITVYTFKENDIDDNITYGASDKALSVIFPGLAVDLGQVFRL